MKACLRTLCSTILLGRVFGLGRTKASSISSIIWIYVMRIYSYITKFKIMFKIFEVGEKGKKNTGRKCYPNINSWLSPDGVVVVDWWNWNPCRQITWQSIQDSILVQLQCLCFFHSLSPFWSCVPRCYRVRLLLEEKEGKTGTRSWVTVFIHELGGCKCSSGKSGTGQ